jgi:hypothetical protein
MRTTRAESVRASAVAQMPAASHVVRARTSCSSFTERTGRGSRSCATGFESTMSTSSSSSVDGVRIVGGVASYACRARRTVRDAGGGGVDDLGVGRGGVLKRFVVTAAAAPVAPVLVAAMIVATATTVPPSTRVRIGVRSSSCEMLDGCHHRSSLDRRP